MKLIALRTLMEKTDSARSTLAEFQSRGLIPRPIRFGRRNLWPEHEIDAVIAAKLAGASNDEIRALVDELHEARKAGGSEAA